MLLEKLSQEYELEQRKEGDFKAEWHNSANTVQTCDETVCESITEEGREQETTSKVHLSNLKPLKKPQLAVKGVRWARSQPDARTYLQLIITPKPAQTPFSKET